VNRLLTRGLGTSALLVTLGLGATVAVPVTPDPYALYTPDAERRLWRPEADVRLATMDAVRLAWTADPALRIYTPDAERRLYRPEAESRVAIAEVEPS
jgi:hypothetical protein